MSTKATRATCANPGDYFMCSERRVFRCTDAAMANVQETGTDPAADIRRIRDGQTTAQQLLEECLNGADDDRVQGWHDYVDAIDEALARMALRGCLT